MSSVFLCHNCKDKGFVRQLSYSLELYGVKTWLDESEIHVGDSLLEKISTAINEMEYLAVILSPDSVASKWVKLELEIAMSDQIQEGGIKVLPILYRDCSIPAFLQGLKYLDFRENSSFDASFQDLLLRVKPEDKAHKPSIYIPVSTGRALSPNAAIVVENLDVWIRSRQVLNNVSFSVWQGEMFGIIGPSGAGKTVLTETLAGLRDFRGRIQIPGCSDTQSNTSRSPYSSPVAMLPSAILALMTGVGLHSQNKSPCVNEQVGLVRIPVRMPERKYIKRRVLQLLKEDCSDSQSCHEQIETALRTAGVWEYIKDKMSQEIHTLSGWDQLRVLLAKCLMRQPKVLILDGILDFFIPVNRMALLEALFRINAKGTTIIVAGLDFTILAPWCDRIAYMSISDFRGSKIQTIGTPADLLMDKANRTRFGIDGTFLQF